MRRVFVRIWQYDRHLLLVDNIAIPFQSNKNIQKGKSKRSKIGCWKCSWLLWVVTSYSVLLSIISLSKRRKYDHISNVLRELHWLPVEHRISYKILLLTYKALNGHAPQYLSALISKYVPPRPLRSEDQYLLSSPRWRLETFGKRAFSKAAPTLWNPLPLSVKQAPSIDSFKTRLKTYLFNKAFW